VDKVSDSVTQNGPSETNTPSALLIIVAVPGFISRHSLDRLSITPFLGEASFIHHWLELVIQTTVKSVWMLLANILWRFTLHEFSEGSSTQGVYEVTHR
jgi:hypothetical protein